VGVRAVARGGSAIGRAFGFSIFLERVETCLRVLAGAWGWRLAPAGGVSGVECAAALAARLAFPVFFFGTGRLECDLVFFLETGARWS
jgi:hypothetical protein